MRISKRLEPKEIREYTALEKKAIMNCWDWYFLRESLPKDEKSWEAAWEQIRDEMLPAWIKEKPFSRPAAWWKWDSGGRRRRLDGPHPFDMEGYPDKHKILFMGLPGHYSVIEGDWDYEFETERVYLKRLGLLTGHEKELAAAE